MSDYLLEAICENCSHPFGDHEPLIAPAGVWCEACCTEPCFNDGCIHDFSPRRFAGGALTPTQERELYEKARKGEL